jgi:hypothetical protein
MRGRVKLTAIGGAALTVKTESLSSSGATVSVFLDRGVRVGSGREDDNVGRGVLLSRHSSVFGVAAFCLVIVAVFMVVMVLLLPRGDRPAGGGQAVAEPGEPAEPATQSA